MLKDVVAGLINGVGPILGGVVENTGGGGGTAPGILIGAPISVDLAVNLGLGSLQLLDLSGNLGSNEKLIVVDGSIFKQSSSGALLDLGLDIGAGPNASGSLINVNGEILGRANDGSLIDLDLNIGPNGLITNVGNGALLPALPALQLLNISASLLDGERLILINTEIFKSNQDGSLVDLGFNVGLDRNSTSPLIVIDGEILGVGANGSLIDLGLDIGVGGWINDGDADGGGGNPDSGNGNGPGTPGGGGGGITDTVDIFRFYNSDTGAHFYTASEAESNSVRANLPQFKFEGNAFDAATDPADGAAVFRFYNSETATHFYTTDAAERDRVIADLDSFSFEGVAYYAFENDGGGEHQALYRFFNTETGTHFYTASDAERVEVAGTLPQYVYEGVAYFVDIA